ncbi:unnamed protein product [Cuscuta campestris]|uniref:Uncharacterized protein n=1 Tax=Cuscuta campestris TaxID=132261 RepID=A0A484N4Z9_9ASTE|nr:unnamed protein product [Cuscuta campestris]
MRIYHHGNYSGSNNLGFFSLEHVHLHSSRHLKVETFVGRCHPLFLSHLLDLDVSKLQDVCEYLLSTCAPALCVMS